MPTLPLRTRHRVHTLPYATDRVVAPAYGTARRACTPHAALAFACIYAPLCTVAYAVELSVVQPLVLRAQADQVALLTLSQYGTQPNTVFSAFDGLGYAFLSLACLFAAPIFGGNRLEHWIRWLLIGTGVIGVPTILTYFVNPAFLWLATPWGITVPGFSVLLAIYFNRLSSPAQLEVFP